MRTPSEHKQGTTNRPLVGAETAEHRAALTQIATELLDVAGGGFDNALNEQIAEIGTSRVRIAVIGQSGADSRRLINALARQPGLMPARGEGAAPLVTRLSFGGADGPEGSANFTFHDEESLAVLAHSPGRLRAAGDPAAEAKAQEAILDQISGIYESAARRLGTRLGKLTGARHRVDQLLPEVLERYLGGAPATDPLASERAGFNGLVRGAEIFLPENVFAGPTQVIDTPGIYGPSPLHEELTLSVLSEADIFIVVFDACRKITTDDGLLLHHLVTNHENRLAIFVDRIDEAQAPDQAMRDCRALVAGILPGLDVPVISGSATMAERALRLEASPEELAKPGAAAMAAELEARSGLPDLSRRLGELIFWGPAFAAHARIASELEALAARAHGALTREAQLSRRSNSDAHEGVSDEPVAIDPLVAEQVNTHHNRALNGISGEVDQIWGQIRNAVLRDLGAEAKKLATELHAKLEEDPKTPLGTVELRRIRTGATMSLMSQFGLAADRLVAYVERVSVGYAEILKGARPNLRLGDPDLTALSEVVPAMESLDQARRVQLDITKRDLVWAGHLTAADRLGEIQRRLIGLFMPIIETTIEEGTLALSQAARPALETLRTHMMDRLAAPEPIPDPEDDHAEALELRARACQEIAQQLAQFRQAADEPGAAQAIKAS